MPTCCPQVPTFLREKLITVNIVLGFLLTPVMLRHFLATFACRGFGAQGLRLAEQPELLCWTGQHVVWTAIAGVFAGVCGVLVPLVALLLIFLRRKRGTLQSRDAVNRLGFLFRSYQPSRWYWELVVHLRKLLVCMILAFGAAHPAFQV